MYHFTEHLLVEVISSLMSFPCVYASVCVVFVRYAVVDKSVHTFINSC